MGPRARECSCGCRGGGGGGDVGGGGIGVGIGGDGRGREYGVVVRAAAECRPLAIVWQLHKFIFCEE